MGVQSGGLGIGVEAGPVVYGFLEQFIHPFLDLFLEVILSLPLVVERLKLPLDGPSGPSQMLVSDCHDTLSFHYSKSTLGSPEGPAREPVCFNSNPRCG